MAGAYPRVVSLNIAAALTNVARADYRSFTSHNSHYTSEPAKCRYSLTVSAWQIVGVTLLVAFVTVTLFVWWRRWLGGARPLMRTG